MTDNIKNKHIIDYLNDYIHMSAPPICRVVKRKMGMWQDLLYTKSKKNGRILIQKKKMK